VVVVGDKVARVSVNVQCKGGCADHSTFPFICPTSNSQTYVPSLTTRSPVAMNLNTLARVSAHNQTALKEGLKIVRKVVASNPYPAGFTTAELFKLVAKETPPADFKALKLPTRPASYARSGNKRTPAPSPPCPSHPIKSMTCVHSLHVFFSANELCKQFSEKICAPHP
jgi:hypothetical protein